LSYKTTRIFTTPRLAGVSKSFVGNVALVVHVFTLILEVAKLLRRRQPRFQCRLGGRCRPPQIPPHWATAW